MQILQIVTENLAQVFHFFLHIDRSLHEIGTQYGVWIYAILFLVIFLETGLVLTPFLPGDSLLFAVGALASRGNVSLEIMLILLTAAAILGDSINYSIGARLGNKVFEREYWFFRREYLLKTKEFFDRYGGKAVILSRFAPIIRTFTPFLAGVGSMKYRFFLIYNVIGAVIWVCLFVLAGYFFGHLPVVQKNFSLIILAIIFISLLPIVFEFWRNRCSSKA